MVAILNVGDGCKIKIDKGTNQEVWFNIVRWLQMGTFLCEKLKKT